MLSSPTLPPTSSGSDSDDSFDMVAIAPTPPTPLLPTVDVVEIAQTPPTPPTLINVNDNLSSTSAFYSASHFKKGTVIDPTSDPTSKADEAQVTVACDDDSVGKTFLLTLMSLKFDEMNDKFEALLKSKGSDDKLIDDYKDQISALIKARDQTSIDHEIVISDLIKVRYDLGYLESESKFEDHIEALKSKWAITSNEAKGTIAQLRSDIIILKKKSTRNIESSRITEIKKTNIDEVNAKIADVFSFALITTLESTNYNAFSSGRLSTSILESYDGYHLILTRILADREISFSRLEFYLKTKWGVSSRNIHVCKSVFTTSHKSYAYEVMRDQMSFLVGPSVKFAIEGEGVDAKLVWKIL